MVSKVRYIFWRTADADILSARHSSITPVVIIAYIYSDSYSQDATESGQPQGTKADAIP